MSEEMKKDAPEEPAVSQAGSEADEAEAKSGAAGKKDTKDVKKLRALIAEMEKKIEAAEAEIADAKDKYLRTLAEYDNFRKRSAKEREGIYADATMDTLATILPILDNLERASQYKEAETVAKGVEMILKSFNDTFEKLGVKEIESLGKTFDPNLHNAVMHIEDENYGENEIVEVLMKGYIKGDKVIRYAMVKVAN